MFQQHKFNNFSYLWKFQADFPNSLVEILFEKRKRYKEYMSSLTFLPASSLAVFIGYIFFVIDSKDLKIAPTAQIN